MYEAAPSLLFSKWGTEFHVLAVSEIPTSPSGSASAAWQTYCPNKVKSPTASETSYLIDVNGGVAKLALPSTAEFQERSEQAMNVKVKYALLKDVKDQQFHDILGEVIKVHDEPGGQVSMHLSDYTPHSEFYNHVWGDGGTSKGRDGDEHGYIKSHPKTVNNWPGPYGKMTIQLTLYDGHATFVREHVKAKHWVLLKNVQFKYGRTGGCLEGILRGDRNAFDGKVQVEILQHAETPEENDPRLLEALARKLAWKRKFEQQRQSLSNEDSGEKRKREDEPPARMNSKAKRKAKRATVEGKAAQKLQTKLELNENSRRMSPNSTVWILTAISTRHKS
jgi:protection-of-telomeres protein 1